MSTISVIGVGAVGARAARQLVNTDGVSRLLLGDSDGDRLDVVATALEHDITIDRGANPERGTEAAVAVLAHATGDHAAQATAWLQAGADVVSVSDDVDDVKALLNLDPLARELGRTVVCGAGFSPGLSCLLAAHGADEFDQVLEVHVAKAATGGPACARQHHKALSGQSVDWRDGGWVERAGGSGRELCWFPSPIDGRDCYRASLADALLLVPAFPGVERVTARMAATRRDRFTMHLPMMRPPHAEGGPGGVRVELRGTRGTSRENRVYGCMDRPSLAAGAVAAVCAAALLEGTQRRTGAGGVAELFAPLPLLNSLASRGVRVATFEGMPTG